MAYRHDDDDLSIKALQKRYEGLVSVRSKAIQGKGAWYWVHLEPILVRNHETGAAKAVKLRCGLCANLFSASNPSRTASEHLKRGTCPNFNGTVPKPSSCAPLPLPAAARTVQSPGNSSTSKKRNVHSLSAPLLSPIVAVDSTSQSMRETSAPPLMLSGGKEDLGALAMLEDSVKKLKSRRAVGQGLSKGQVDAALNLLAEWVYESCGSVPLSCVEHPKFKAFLNQVGLPPVSRRYLAGPKLDAKFEEVRSKSEARFRDALFFQLASEGWWKKMTFMGETLINVTLNLPNGTSLFCKVVILTNPSVSVKVVEETLWESIIEVSGAALERCVGIVADTDKYTLEAMRELESKNRWMVNLPCQIQGFSSLLKSFYKHLSLFRSVDCECRKVAAFFAGKPGAWAYLQKLQGNEFESGKLLKTLPTSIQFGEPPQHLSAIAVAEDINSSARILQMAGTDGSFKLAYADDPLGRDVVEMVSGMRFWSDLEALLSLVKLVNMIVQEIEIERPSVSQCLPLWVDLRSKVKDWCAKYNKDEGPLHQVIEKKFIENYHPAWSAAFVLDPLYLIRDNSGKYLPPYKLLTAEQEKDVDRLITRLVSHEEAPVAVMELLKWRANGLDPLYAQAVQMKERDPVTGKLRPVTPQSRRLVWETCLSEFKVLGKVAVRLIFLHATSSRLRCNWSIWKWVYRNGNTQIAAEMAQKMIFIASHAKLEHKDMAGDEDDMFFCGDDNILPDEDFVNPTL